MNPGDNRFGNHYSRKLEKIKSRIFPDISVWGFDEIVFALSNTDGSAINSFCGYLASQFALAVNCMQTLFIA